MTTHIYAVRNKYTGEFQVYNGRCAWTKKGNAKNAFDSNTPCMSKHTFDTGYDKVYEIVELTSVYNELMEKNKE